MMDVLNSSPALWIALATVLGLLVGSFLNVVVHRLPKMMHRQWLAQCAELLPDCASATTTDGLPQKYTLVVPRSACPKCGHQIRAIENIPVLSYLALRGRCSRCQARISPRYPIVELVTGILSGLLAWRFGFGAQAATSLLLLWALIALTLVDFDTQLLPDSITQPLLWLGMIVNSFGVFTDLPSAVFGAIAGYLVLWTVYWVFKLITQREGMGYGDFKLLAAIGAWLGWQVLPVVILLSSAVGAVVGIALILLARRGRSVPIPFGPYLAGGGLIALVAGSQLTSWYLNNF